MDLDAAVVRQRLLTELPHGDDFDAFCCDCFPASYRCYGPGMDRQERISRLLNAHAPAEVAMRLDRWLQLLRTCALDSRPARVGRARLLGIGALVVAGGLYGVYRAAARAPDVAARGVPTAVVQPAPAGITPTDLAIPDVRASLPASPQELALPAATINQVQILGPIQTSGSGTVVIGTHNTVIRAVPRRRPQ